MEKRWHKFYPKDVPKEIEIPCLSLYQLLERTALDYGAHKAVIDGEREWMYTELKENVDRLASALRKRGAFKGERIAIMFPNSIEYIVAYYAAQRLGCVVVQVNPMYQKNELEFILENSGANWIIGSYSQKEKINSVSYAAKMKKVYDGFFQPSENEYNLYQLISEEKNIDLEELAVDPKRDIAVLQYTGGTTGRAKGVMLTHYNLVANVYQTFTFSAGYYERPGERILSISPFFHVYGMTSCMNVAIFAAATIICLPRFDVDKTIEMIEKHRPTFFPGVPTMYIALLHHPKASSLDMSCFKILNSGSAPMPAEVTKEFEKKTGAFIVEGFGLSETSPVTHRNPVFGPKKVGSIGIPLPNTDSKIIDLETGEELPPNEPGELIIKGPQVMLGYWQNEEETKQALRDGWVFTGDIAKMDEDGYFYIVGRKKDMIIAGGYNIYPVEVEEVIYQHPCVEEVCVFGVPDSYRGETVKAAIVLRQGMYCTETEIIEWCQSRMARYKVPKIIEFRSSLPKTTVGKILRRKLVEEALEMMQKEEL